jgi:hypothetical protein
VSCTSVPRRSVYTVVVAAAATAACALVAQAGLGAFGAGAAPPAPLVSSAPLRPTISTRATVAFDRRSGAGYECALDGGSYASCPTPVTFRGLTRSSHVFRVRARNSAGKTSRASAYAWTVVPRHLIQRRLMRKNVYLRPLLTTAPVRPWISRNATFAWVLQRSATAECRLDAGRWKPCARLTTYLGLSLGTHVFSVRAKRANGPRSRANRFVWTIVSSAPPPPPPITSRPDENTTSADAIFEFDVAAENTAECRLDGNDREQCSAPVMYVGLGTGTHTFCVRAISPDGVAGSETCVSWNMLGSEGPPEPSGAFTISGVLPGLLTPGASGLLPLRVSNPYDFDLRVWALRVNVLPGSSQPGCDARANLQVSQSNTSGGAVSIVVPARSSVALPNQGATAPLVTMLDLAVSQDACKSTVFSFSFSGTGTRA